MYTAQVGIPATASRSQLIVVAKQITKRDVETTPMGSVWNLEIWIEIKVTTMVITMGRVRVSPMARERVCCQMPRAGQSSRRRRMHQTTVSIHISGFVCNTDICFALELVPSDEEMDK